MSKYRVRGFTLIELIVGVFIFSILIVLAGGSLVPSLELQRRALNIKRVEENGRFVLELMTRELRVANPINTADSGCPGSGGSSLSFTHPVNGSIEYFLSGTAVHRRVNGADSVISNPDVEVSRLTFCVSGNSMADDRQPRVSMILGLKAGGLNSQADALDLQTTVSQRVLRD